MKKPIKCAMSDIIKRVAPPVDHIVPRRASLTQTLEYQQKINFKI